MLELLEQQKSLTINQWKIFLACFFSLALDFFDFFLISFVLAFFVRDWNLTYGQSALILLSSGVASVPAGYFFGAGPASVAFCATRSAAGFAARPPVDDVQTPTFLRNLSSERPTSRAPRSPMSRRNGATPSRSSRMRA